MYKQPPHVLLGTRELLHAYSNSCMEQKYGFIGVKSYFLLAGAGARGTNDRAGRGNIYLYLHMARQPHFILRLAGCLPTLLLHTQTNHQGLFFFQLLFRRALFSFLTATLAVGCEVHDAFAKQRQVMLGKYYEKRLHS